MRIFIDTEFTSFKNPKLISIGMVSEDGHEFYYELTDTWTLPDCSLFVIGWVLPWLSDGYAGKCLYGLLDLHLSLIQYECDTDCLFPKKMEELLRQSLNSNSELMEHLRFLADTNAASELTVWKNPHVAPLLQRVKPEKLLKGEQSASFTQVRRKLHGWLDQFEDPVFCCDSDYDSDLLEDLIERPAKIDFSACKSIHYDDLQRHHALADAQALRRGIQASEG